MLVASGQDRAFYSYRHESLDLSRDVPSVSLALFLSDCFVNTLDDIQALTRPPGTIQHDINDVFDPFGPTARLCVSYNQSQLDAHEREVSKAVKNVTPSQLKRLFTDSESLHMDAISNKICLVSRGNQKDVHSEVIIAPITPSIQSRLANQLRNIG